MSFVTMWNLLWGCFPWYGQVWYSLGEQLSFKKKKKKKNLFSVGFCWLVVNNIVVLVMASQKFYLVYHINTVCVSFNLNEVLLQVVRFSEVTVELKRKGPQEVPSPVSNLKHSQLCIQTRLHSGLIAGLENFQGLTP